MITRYRAWLKNDKEMIDVDEIHFDNGQLDFIGDGITFMRIAEKIVLMQSTGLFDKNGQEIFEGDILKFNDEWPDYCYEGYVDGSTEGINYVEVERKTTCFAFGKTRIPETSLTNLVEDEHYPFEDLITEKSFEFEIVGNVYQTPELLEANHDRD